MKNHFFWISFAIHSIILFFFGPAYTSDSGGYINWADDVLKNPELLWSLDFTMDPFPTTALRMPLYPLIIAFCKITAGHFWSYAVCFCQIIVFSMAFQTVMNFAEDQGIRKFFWLSVIGFFIIFPRTCVSNVSIMTDSIFNSCALMLLVNLIRLCIFQEKKSLYLCLVFLLGLFVREPALFFIISLLPIMIYAGKKHLKDSLIVLGGALTIAGSILLWNTARSGQTFLTTGGHCALYVTFGEFCQDHPSINMYSGNTPVDQLGPIYFNRFTEDGMDEFFKGINVLYKEFGLNALDIARINQTKFKELWLTYPIEMIESSWKRFYDALIFIPVLGLMKHLDKDQPDVCAQKIMRASPVKKNIYNVAHVIDVGIRLFFIVLMGLIFPYLAFKRKNLNLLPFFPLY
jgi:hypothetical protein